MSDPRDSQTSNTPADEGHSGLDGAVERLQRALGYTFGDRRVLLQSLTHTSYGHEHHPELAPAQRDNERLEFLGDAILDAVISDILLEAFPGSSEGQLTKIRAALVNERALAEIAQAIGVGQCIRLGKGELLTGGAAKPSILSSTLEAVVAAVYLDGGFHGIYPVVRHLFAPALNSGQMSEASLRDHKTSLQEAIQAQLRQTPVYTLIGSTGPDHAKTFEVEVRVQDRVLARATGSSKKEAEQSAAREALNVIAHAPRGNA